MFYRILIILLFFSSGLFAQTTRRFADTLLSVHIDSPLLVTAKKGLKVAEFIEVMMNDTMFYEAFKNMKKFSFIAENRISTFNDKNKKTSKIYRKIFHNNTKEPYRQDVLEAKDSGKVYDRKGNYDLYTVEMFSYIFMNDKNTDYIEANTVGSKNKQEDKGDEGYKDKLKTLIFTPGKPVHGIPLISNKTAIFSDELRPYYNFSFYHATYQDSIPVYYFKCKMKDGLSKSKQEDLMIKEMTTIFDGRNFNILGRYIDMSYFSIPFDFDVQMNIELAYTNELLVPVIINYKGKWDIPFKDAEDCTFDIKHYNFKPGFLSSMRSE